MLKADATVEEKSLALAELMGWEIGQASDMVNTFTTAKIAGLMWTELSPYTMNANGLAQFAAILLEFPKVFDRISFSGDVAVVRIDPVSASTGYVYVGGIDLNQSFILDEILRMNGKME